MVSEAKGGGLLCLLLMIALKVTLKQLSLVGGAAQHSETGYSENGSWILIGLRPTWSTEQVPAQPGLHRGTLSQKKKKKENNEAKLDRL